MDTMFWEDGVEGSFYEDHDEVKFCKDELPSFDCNDGIMSFFKKRKSKETKQQQKGPAFGHTSFDYEAFGSIMFDIHEKKTISRETFYGKESSYKNGRFPSECVERFYEEDLNANLTEHGDLIKKLLTDIETSLPRFRDTDEIKQQFIDKLHFEQISLNDIGDLNLNTMVKLNAISQNMKWNKLFSEVYIGLYQCIWCLQKNENLAKSSVRLIGTLKNVVAIIRHGMLKQGFVVPDGEKERTKYKKLILNHLESWTDEYLHGCVNRHICRDYRFLKIFLVLIMDYQIVSEIQSAISSLVNKIQDMLIVT
ncbi:uncharacterized protein LOC124434026 [Xenia sp. Carnegie-2017]|uniref:uncharacterized protein LOC124434026 n=1 Tax=Xenia sp. Carnegie-2017 TaxID=2897299 RepID=UPI001F04843D|nr:uncharacterized protein LOC124434026 [Xenia sp. Carnegie-2017]